MTPADHYRIKAAECEARAQSEPRGSARIEFQMLAKAYRRLAELADRNAQVEVVYEPPFFRPRNQVTQ